jgi:dihydroorotate dehydrogenase (NAD+) catalytic subunit
MSASDGAHARSAAPGEGATVSFCGMELAHRVINGSGTFDVRAARMTFGAALDEHFPFAAFVSKTITLEPRDGNQPPRLWESAAGLINSIGLPNKGVAAYMDEEVPALAGLTTRARGGERVRVPLITNVMGPSAQELELLVEACEERAEIAAVELNVSCPNVKSGLDIGADPAELEAVVKATRARTRKPLIVKLTPNCADVAACAAAAQAGGADAVSLINTLRALALAPRRDGKTRSPWLGGHTGGLSGAAVRAIALAQVAAVAQRVEVPVVGMGGVQTAAHARELIDVGAALVAVGTESFRDPAAAAAIALAL